MFFETGFLYFNKSFEYSENKIKEHMTDYTPRLNKCY